MPRLPTPEEVSSWPPPNYVNPQTRRSLILGVEIPLVALVIIFTSMRFYSRAVIIKALGLDDWFMLAASIIATATSIMTCVSTLPQIATGYHLWDLPPQILMNPVKSAQIALATQLLFALSTAFMKISVLLTYLRIFPSTTNKWFCYAMLTFTVAWAVSAFFSVLLQCSPIESYWLPAQYPNRKCIDNMALYYSTGALNLMSDFLIFLWPARDLANLQISLTQKVSLIFMFCLGVTICIAGCLRIYVTHIYQVSVDSLWTGATLYLVVAVETSIGILCGCIPACKPLITKIAPHIFFSTQNSTHKSTNKKSSKFGSQSFPFESLSGGIVKDQVYSVEYDDAGISYLNHSSTENVKVTQARVRIDEDAISAESQEWIIMKEMPKVSSEQK